MRKRFKHNLSRHVFFWKISRLRGRGTWRLIDHVKHINKIIWCTFIRFLFYTDRDIMYLLIESKTNGTQVVKESEEKEAKKFYFNNLRAFTSPQGLNIKHFVLYCTFIIWNTHKPSHVLHVNNLSKNKMECKCKIRSTLIDQ